MDGISLLLIATLWIQIVTGTPTEYCEAEEFAPDCPHGHVVVMTMAHYGRTAIGRCVQVNYGYMGCYADALSVMDELCSGREFCNVRIPGPLLDATDVCPFELKTYLNASYSCVPVETSQCTQCETSTKQKTQLTLPEGYLASWVTSHSGCGSVICPWIIDAQPGQRVNLTLYDSNHTSIARKPWDPSSVCYVLAIVRDYNGSKTICRGRERERHAFMSVGHKLEIRVVSPVTLKSFGHFLLHYEVVGCPDYEPPPKMLYHRVDDHVTVWCTDGDTSWDLYCNGTEWVGMIGVCPDVYPTRGDIMPELVSNTSSISTTSQAVIKDNDDKQLVMLLISTFVTVCVLKK